MISSSDEEHRSLHSPAAMLGELLRLYAPGGVAQKLAAADPKMSGLLKTPATSAWHMGAYPKPKTTAPRRPGQAAEGMPTTKPPSNRAYHQDVTKSLNDPARGVRLSLPQS
jgi:hypothetical protein